MMPFFDAVLALVIAAQVQPPPHMTGPIPHTLETWARALWVAASGNTGDARCDVSTPRQWSCDGLPPDARGLVVLIGDGAVATAAVGVSDADATIAKWGRVIRVTAGGAAPEDLHDLRITAWKPERPRARPQTRRFSPIEDGDVHAVRLSDTSFWVSGNVVDPDAFVSLDGPAIGRSAVSTLVLSEGAPDDPVFLPAAAPLTITGRVHGAHGEDAEGADVELLEPLHIADTAPERLDEGTPLLRRLSITASADGRFQFDRLSGGPFRITASHSVFGHGATWLRLAGAPVDIELTPALKATARVLKHGLPAAAARVRFLPDPEAWATSVDPKEHISQETTTATDGTFSLPLPPKRHGTIQILLDDGTGVRVALPTLQTKGDVQLGDLAVPDSRRLVVRLLDGIACNVMAVGPLGALGLQIVQASSQTTVYDLALPDAGAWALNADCGGDIHEIDPPVVVVPADGQPPAVDAHVVKWPGDS